MKFSTTIGAVASLIASVTAHGGVGLYTIGTTAYKGWSPYNAAAGQVTIQREYPSFNPLLMADLTTVNIRCNNPGDLGTGVSAPINAGATIKATWTQWTHRPAVIMIYMAKCPSTGCNSWDGSGTVWFKIFHEGLVSGTEGNGTWAGDQIVDTLNWTVTIPPTLAAGDYLIRHELLALHQANNPQFYPECAQLTVGGTGTVTPPSSIMVAFPGAYVASNPSIDFNIDSPAAFTTTAYPIPGPVVWDGTGTQVAPAQPSVAPTSAASPAAATSAAAVAACGPVTKYGQCGGTGYTGCTVCVSGSTCTAQGSYYSQCM